MTDNFGSKIGVEDEKECLSSLKRDIFLFEDFVNKNRADT